MSHSNTDTSELTQQDSLDRNFDDIAEHFSRKVYGGLKGQIRLAVLRRDIFAWVDQQTTKLQRPLRVIDVGAGLAQLSIELAQQGCDVTVNDISANMLAHAQLRPRPLWFSNLPSLSSYSLFLGHVAPVYRGWTKRRRSRGCWLQV